MSSGIEEQLSSVGFFSGLSKRAVSRLAGQASVVEHQPGKEVASEGKGALAFHLILEGDAEVTVGGTKRRDLGAGDYFGEISMIDGKPRSATVTATTPLKTAAIHHAAFGDLLAKHPEVAVELLTVLCARLREAESA
jgi:CRP/FNR family transcriptional regulator, cyclic AMP receptor protein